jgi:hypothetical protein
MNTQYSPSETIVARAAAAKSLGKHRLRAVPLGDMARPFSEWPRSARVAVAMQPSRPAQARSELAKLLAGTGLQKVDLVIVGLSVVWCLAAVVQQLAHL